MLCANQPTQEHARGGSRPSFTTAAAAAASAFPRQLKSFEVVLAFGMAVAVAVAAVAVAAIEPSWHCIALLLQLLQPLFSLLLRLLFSLYFPGFFTRKRFAFI